MKMENIIEGLLIIQIIFTGMCYWRLCAIYEKSREFLREYYLRPGSEGQ